MLKRGETRKKSEAMNPSNLSGCPISLFAGRATEEAGTRDYDDSWREVFYAPIPDYVHYMCAAILVFLLVPGILGNSAAIAIFAQ